MYVKMEYLSPPSLFDPEQMILINTVKCVENGEKNDILVKAIELGSFEAEDVYIFNTPENQLLLELVESDSVSLAKQDDQILVFSRSKRRSDTVEEKSLFITYLSVIEGRRALSRGEKTMKDYLLGVLLPDKTQEMTGQVEGIRVSLHPFQRRTLRWMQMQEEQKRKYDLSIKLPNGKYFEPFEYMFYDNKVDHEGIRGGMLLEEMGLGKTMEVCALIKSRQATKTWMKGKGHEGRKRVKSTLVVAPQAILHQWRDEIESKTDMTFTIYKNVTHKNPEGYDIILTSLETLRNQLHYMYHEEYAIERRKRKYSYPKCIFTTFEFWRVILDEAQMIESLEALSTKACMRLYGENEWVVTGTPISHSLVDLHAQLCFLRNAPPHFKDNVKVMEQSEEHFQRFCDYLQTIARRTTHEDVKEELLLPELNQEIIYLDFNPVETYHYSMLLQVLLKQWKRDARSSYFYRLRQACSVVVTRETSEALHTIQQVVDDMIKTVKGKVDSAKRHFLRLKIQRGTYFEVQQDWDKALEIYKTCQKECSTEWFDLLHQCYFNQASVYLQSEKKDLSNEFYALAESVRNSSLGVMEMEVLQARQQYENSKREKELEFSHLVFPDDVGFELEDDVRENYQKTRGVLFRMKEHHNLLLAQIEKIMEYPLAENYEQDAIRQEEGLDLMNNLTKILHIVKEIHLSQSHSVKCNYPEKKKKDARNDVSTKQEDENDQNNIPTSVWTLYHIRNNATPIHSYFIDEERKKTLTHLEKLTSLLSKVWNSRISYYKRLQEFSDHVRLPENIQDWKRAFSQLEKEMTEFQRKIRQEEAKFRFLQHISSSERIDCPICHSPFSKGLFLPCAHMGCDKCISAWLRQSSHCPLCMQQTDRRNIIPIVFKEESSKENIATTGLSTIATPSVSFQSDPLRHSVKGGFGSKITALVSYLLHLQNTSPGTKSIVFSQWQNVLTIIADALSQNQLKFVFFTPESVYQFNQDPSIQVFLLHSTMHSAGLTLTAATHLFLMEPLLNPSLEMQAIHRVYRIGQSNNVFIHRFIVKGTIETIIHDHVSESISSALPTSAKIPTTDSYDDILFYLRRLEQNSRVNQE